MKKAIYLLFDPFFRVELAVALGAIGRADQAISEIDEALRNAADTGYRWFVPEILRSKGRLLVLRGLDDPALIEDLFRQSMRQARAQRADYWELCASTSLAETLQRRHKEVEARRVLAPVYDRFTEGFFASRLKRAKALLDQLA
jgi:non-specific serine/threonine protein kinase